jgi:hypothetical protein
LPSDARRLTILPLLVFSLVAAGRPTKPLPAPSLRHYISPTLGVNLQFRT